MKRYYPKQEPGMSMAVKVIVGVFLLIVIFSIFRSCQSDNHYNVNIQSINMAHEGLNLQSVGTLLKKTKDAKELEELINSKSEGINNLDLNDDGKVDYIHVSEYGSGDKARGFSLYTELAKDDKQEIATIEIEKLEDQASVQVHGNQQIYGHGHYYHNHFGITDFILMSYLFSPHPYYYSPYNYGYYPSYYRGHSVQSTSTYNSRMKQKNSSSSFKKASTSQNKTSLKSPNAGKTSNRVKTPLKNPTASQKSFQKANPSRATVKAKGFGRSSSRPSIRSSGRSGGFFGGK